MTTVTGYPRRAATRSGATRAAQLGILAVLTVGSMLTIRPLAWSGRGSYPTVLLVVTVASLLAVVLRRRDDDVTGVALTAGAAVAAALLFGAAPDSWAQGFGFFLVVMTGSRAPAAISLPIALLTSATAMTVLAVSRNAAVPWWVGLAFAASVVLGMLRRSREQELAAVHDALQQAKRATESEATARRLADRADLARDLHDVLAHSLSGVSMQLSMVEALLQAGRTDQAQAAVRDARAQVVTGLTEARQAIRALREDNLELVPALQAMVRSEPGAKLTVTGNGTQIPVAAVHTVIRTAQEAMTNARKHAPGSTISLVLHRQPAALTLTVSNGPATRAPDAPSGSGLGLVGMRERAELAGGSVTAGPITDGDDAGGWQVRLQLPAHPGAPPRSPASQVAERAQPRPAAGSETESCR